MHELYDFFNSSVYRNLYGKKSKFSMRRSSSQGFYKFDNDESFHNGTGSVTKLNGSALKEKYACITPVLKYTQIFHKHVQNF